MSGSVCQGYPSVKEHVARKNESCVSYAGLLDGKLLGSMLYSLVG